MLRNYLTIAIRHLTRHKLFSVINIVCLAIGICFSMLIGIYVMKERSVDRGLRNLDNQYIIKSDWKVKDMGMDITTLGPLAKTMKEEYPNLVANYYRYNPVGTVLSAGDKHFSVNIAIGDTTLVSMYGFPVLYGDPQKAFLNNQSAVITESIAMKLFGRRNVLGKAIYMQTAYNGEKQQYQISAVLKDIPSNSVTGLIGLDYEVFVPTIGNHFYNSQDPSEGWTSVYEVGFIELKSGIRPKDMQKPFEATLKKYATADIQANLKVELAAVKDYYLQNNHGAHAKMTMALSLIALFILVMAIFNFVNISIGTSSYRLKEIGLRMVFGSGRRQLIAQYFAESIILVLVAGAIGLGAYQALIPAFNQVLNTSLLSVTKFDLSGWLLLGVLVLGVGFLAGIYPALVLSRSNIILSIKGKLEKADLGISLRKVLLVIQFSLAVLVFICAMNISRQVKYFFEKDLGYSREQVMIITAYPKRWDSVGVARMKSIKEQLLTLPSVKNASICFEIPERKPPASLDMRAEDLKSAETINIPTTFADEDYASTFGLKLLDGHFFRPGYEGFVSNEVILNESAVRALGLDIMHAIGRKIIVPSSKTEYTVRGIIKNYNYASLQEGIGPMAIIQMQEMLAYRYMSLKLNPGNFGQIVSEIGKNWQKMAPEAPFEWFLMDDRFNKLYRSELQLKKATEIGTIQNLVIVFLGIFGLVAFTLARRSREMAVRKVLGASIRDIVWLFLRDYAGLIVIANLIAWPLAYYTSNRWLENYAYRINQNIITYLAVGLLVFVLSFLLIVIQCFKDASANPVHSLRNE
ncbi:MAG: ABC transporter permease [Chitinophagales bacterium]